MSEVLNLPGLAGPGTDAAAGVSSGEAPAPAARVIGLDPSLTGCGIADGRQTWLIGSTAPDEPTLMLRGDRIRTLAKAVLARIPLDTQLVIVEGDAPHQTMGNKHDRAGLWWLIVSNLQTAGVPVAEVTPSQIKIYATGNGNCNKALVIDATARRYPNVDTGANDNRCDAHWAAAMGIDHLTDFHVVPAKHRATLAKVRWPS